MGITATPARWSRAAPSSGCGAWLPCRNVWLPPCALPAVCLLLPALALLPATQAVAARFDAPIPETIHYEQLGRVTTTRDWYHPRYRVFNPTPRPRGEVNATITLYTRHLAEQGVRVWPLLLKPPAERNGATAAPTTTAKTEEKSKLEINWASPEALYENVDGSLPTRIIVHGWRGALSTWMKEMAVEFLKREPCNVFIVQWDGGVNYFQATQDIRVVALEIAALINHLAVKCGLRGSDVHLVGHSLGAHTCGYVGQHVPGVGRITGLDPADPSYTYMPEFVRLDPSDADFVDVIHTDSQSILGNGLGMRQPVGHLDFFPNAGRYQPGCELWKVPEAALRKGVRGVVSAAADFTVCSHSRAPSLFTESINSHCRFLAFRCASYMALHLGQCISCGNNMERCAVMGMDADKFMPAEGFSRNSSFFLTTANEPPFCQHPYAVRIFPADMHNTSHWGHLSVELRGISGLVKELPLTENDDLTGPLPLVGIRLPNPLRRVAEATAAATTGPREVPPRQPLLLVGWARNFTGQRVLSAALRWESVDRSPLRRLIPCFFRCADPLSVARIVVRTFPHPLREVDSELCPEGGQDVVEIDSRSSATLTLGCEGRQQQRPRKHPRAEALAQLPQHTVKVRRRGLPPLQPLPPPPNVLQPPAPGGRPLHSPLPRPPF